MNYSIEHKDKTKTDIKIRQGNSPDHYDIKVNGKEFRAELLNLDETEIIFKIDGKVEIFQFAKNNENDLQVFDSKGQNNFSIIDERSDALRRLSQAAGSGLGTVKSSMPGKIIEIFVSNGDEVKSGQKILILEAMKMENEIVAPCDGPIKLGKIEKGGEAKANQVLFSIG